jgi:DNA-binding NarL/FixJ family response regulator
MATDGRVVILFIDSYHTERNYYADQLMHLSSDYEIYHAANGKTGIAACLAQPIDCVLLEINLSDMSGFDVLQELVRNPASQAVAVIVLTHLTNPFILDLAVKNGALYGLCKSSIPADVLDKYILKAISTNQDNRKPTPQEDAAPLLPFGCETSSSASMKERRPY